MQEIPTIVEWGLDKFWSVIRPGFPEKGLIAKITQGGEEKVGKGGGSLEGVSSPAGILSAFNEDGQNGRESGEKRLNHGGERSCRDVGGDQSIKAFSFGVMDMLISVIMLVMVAWIHACKGEDWHYRCHILL